MFRNDRMTRLWWGWKPRAYGTTLSSSAGLVTRTVSRWVFIGFLSRTGVSPAGERHAGDAAEPGRVVTRCRVADRPGSAGVRCEAVSAAGLGVPCGGGDCLAWRLVRHG